MLNEIVTNYIKISFEIDKHVTGLVDAYFGPNELRSEVEGREKKPLLELIKLIDEQVAGLEAEDKNDARIRQLKKQFEALKTLARVQGGEKLSYLDEVSLQYDIHPSKISEEECLKVIRKVDDLLPGSGSVAERMDKFRGQFIIPKEVLLGVLNEAAEFFRGRTKNLIPSFKNENYEIRLVKNQPWNAYNWFKGDGHSLIEINTDLPFYLNSLLHIVSHELYPGHHTELTIKENLLFKNKNYLEFSTSLMLTPRCIIAEGIAEIAGEIVSTQEERNDYLKKMVLPKLPNPLLDLERYCQIYTLLNRLKGIRGNASFLLFNEGVSGEAAQDYLRKYELLNQNQAAKAVEFIKFYRGYIFTYSYGYKLIKKYLHGKDVKKEFVKLLTTPVSPSDLE